MNIKQTIFLSGFLLLFMTVQAQWTQIGSDIDGEVANDQFGWRVCLSDDGSIMASSAPYNADGGATAGNVRIFQNLSGSWTQLGQSIIGAAPQDGFGRGMSMNADGSMLAIGAPFHNGWDGQVRVYQNQSGTWTQIGQDIDGQNTGEFFGRSVSLSDDGATLAVGAIYNTINGSNSGQVRIYQNIAGTWTQIGSNLSGDAEDDFFGYAVSLSSDGSIAAISAPINDSNGSTDIGYVRIFQNTGGTWTQMGQDIDADNVGDQFGSSISISADGMTLAMGALGIDGGNGDYSGEVRVYEYNTGNWGQVGLSIPGEAAWDFFGESARLSADGSIVAAGASASDENGTESGHVRAYININGTWTQLGHDIAGEAAGDRFGTAIGLSADGSVLAVGATVNAGNGTLAGHVRVYGGVVTDTEEYLDIESAISVFPNPTTGIVSIKSDHYDIKSIGISDLSGRLIESLVPSNNTVNIRHYAKGIYFFKIMDEDMDWTTFKVVKQ